MYKIVALFGEAGTGKDFMLNKVLAARPDWHTSYGIYTVYVHRPN